MSETAEFTLETLKVSELPELVGFEQKQKDLVADNPYVEITDTKSYDIACKSRTALLKGRTSLEAQDKLIASKLSSFRREVGEKTKSLIEITLPSEEKQQEEVKRYEAEKQAEKDALARAEEIRVEKIKTDIDGIETYCYGVIQKMTFDNLKESSQSIDEKLVAEHNFEEYDLLFDQVKDRVVKQLLEKTNDITARENQRLENEAMKQEIFEVRINRFKELGFVVDDIDVFRSTELSHTYTKDELLNIDSATFERAIGNIKQAKEEAEQAKRDAELKKQKDEQFEIRKNRLAEIGFGFIPTQGFGYREFNLTLDSELIYDADVSNFEQRLINAKKLIADSKEQKELADQKAKELEEQELKIKEEADKKAIADKKKFDSENKSRVKRLSGDKEIITKSLEVYFADLHLETENQEIKDFIDTANAQVQQLKSDLLTQLNNL